MTAKGWDQSFVDTRRASPGAYPIGSSKHELMAGSIRTARKQGEARLSASLAWAFCRRRYPVLGPRGAASGSSLLSTSFVSSWWLES